MGLHHDILWPVVANYLAVSMRLQTVLHFVYFPIRSSLYRSLIIEHSGLLPKQALPMVPSKPRHYHHASSARSPFTAMHEPPHPRTNPPHNLTPPTDNFFQSSSSNLTYLSPSGLIQKNTSLSPPLTFFPLNSGATPSALNPALSCLLL